MGRRRELDSFQIGEEQLIDEGVSIGAEPETPTTVTPPGSAAERSLSVPAAETRAVDGDDAAHGGRGGAEWSVPATPPASPDRPLDADGQHRPRSAALPRLAALGAIAAAAAIAVNVVNRTLSGSPTGEDGAHTAAVDVAAPAKGRHSDASPAPTRPKRKQSPGREPPAKPNSRREGPKSTRSDDEHASPPAPTPAPRPTATASPPPAPPKGSGTTPSPAPSVTPPPAPAAPKPEPAAPSPVQREFGVP